ncbi:MAG: succinylglutamate desuccinylase/aspartoacylase family protein [Gammaproteobacteria bacterium]|nr:succinylglutamate desuccinylase/aspartoacylase family protein [Gammaproteobacteria bacterium]
MDPGFRCPPDRRPRLSTCGPGGFGIAGGRHVNRRWHDSYRDPSRSPQASTSETCNEDRPISVSSTGNFAVELAAPDISAYRHGNTGVDYVTTFDSGRPGPHVMITALVHGNEICGAIALDFLFRNEVRPLQGRLTLAFANVDAYQRFDPAAPTLSRYVDEDFNRLWDEATLNGPRDSVELRRARALRPIVAGVDVLLDIHSMQQENVPLMLCGPLAKGADLAFQLGAPEHVVADPGHAAGKRMRDHGDFGRADRAANALLIECGQHWRHATADVALDVAIRFLDVHGMLSEAFVERHIKDPNPPAQRLIEVSGPYTIETDRFRFVQDFKGMEVIAKAGTLIGFDGDKEVRTPHDGCVLIMPSRRRRQGESALRYGRYVK